jgi:dTDP-4-amino-4,6-dideoxygalactose transaminase
MLNVKLSYLKQWNEKRVNNAYIYRELLSKIPSVKIPISDPNASPVYHLYVIRVNEREALIKHLKEKGITTGIHYPIGLPFLEAYKYLGHSKEDFPVTHEYQSQILSLPMFPELTREQIMRIYEEIVAFL